MEAPTLQVTMRDNEMNIEYAIYAYRRLLRPEAVQAVKLFRTSKQGKRVKRGARYKIITTIGYAD